VITAISAALLGAGLGGRFGTKRVYLAGLVAGLCSMGLLIVSAYVSDRQSLAYPLLLLATAFLGAGFGLTVPALNTLAAAFHREATNRAILVLNALLGLGTVLAPVFVAFWGMVTLGRVLFAALERSLPPRVTYHLLPFVLAAAFVVIALLPNDSPWLGVLVFALAGLGCSALLPLTISFGQDELTTFSAAVAGGVIACYQLGYGIAAFGVGPLLDHGVGLPTIYWAAAVVALGLAAMSLMVARRPRTASLGLVGSAGR
jgi:MFS family permease